MDNEFFVIIRIIIIFFRASDAWISFIINKSFYSSIHFFKNKLKGITVVQ